jgi:heavy metal sensor kinase
MLSLRVKLILWYSALFFLVLVVFGVAIYIYLSYSLLNIIDTSLTDQAEILVHNYQASQQQTFSQSLNISTDARIVPQFVQFIDAKGQVVDEIQDTERTPIPVNISSLPADKPKIETLKLNSSEEIRIITWPLYLADNKTIDLYIRVGQSLAVLQTAQKKLLTLLVSVLLVTLLVASLGGLFLANKALTPIANLSQAVKRISANNLQEQVKVPKSNDEISQLANLFNEMLSRLEKAFEREHQFTADASHELRTPLAIIRSELEIALRKDRNIEDYKEIISRTLSETLRLSKLVEDLLTLARSEKGDLALEKNSLSISNLLREICQFVEPLALAKGLSLTYVIPEQSIVMIGDAKRLRQMVLNLLDNAIKYTDTGEIKLLLTQTNNDISIIVSDTGQGIKEDEQALIFERFYRHSHTNTNDNAGFGLGLAICKWIVEAHNGKILLDSKLGQGSTFTISVPKKSI